MPERGSTLYLVRYGPEAGLASLLPPEKLREPLALHLPGRSSVDSQPHRSTRKEATMKKKTGKKLVLAKETVRLLQGEVEGGARITRFGCDTTICTASCPIPSVCDPCDGPPAL